MDFFPIQEDAERALAMRMFVTVTNALRAEGIAGCEVEPRAWDWATIVRGEDCYAVGDETEDETSPWWAGVRLADDGDETGPRHEGPDLREVLRQLIR